MSLIGLKNEILDETAESQSRYALRPLINALFTPEVAPSITAMRFLRPDWTSAGAGRSSRRAELPAAAPGAHAKYDLRFCAVPDELGHMYEMPDPELLWQSVLAFAVHGPEHRDPQFYMRHGDVENCESQ